MKSMTRQLTAAHATPQKQEEDEEDDEDEDGDEEDVDEDEEEEVGDTTSPRLHHQATIQQATQISKVQQIAYSLAGVVCGTCCHSLYVCTNLKTCIAAKL